MYLQSVMSDGRADDLKCLRCWIVLAVVSMVERLSSLEMCLPCVVYGTELEPWG